MGSFFSSQLAQVMSMTSAMGWLRVAGNRGWLSPWFQGRLVVVGLGWLCLGQLEFWARFHESHLPTGWPGCVLVGKAEGQEGERRCTNTFQAPACLVFINILVTKVSHRVQGQALQGYRAQSKDPGMVKVHKGQVTSCKATVCQSSPHQTMWTQDASSMPYQAPPFLPRLLGDWVPCTSGWGIPSSRKISQWLETLPTQVTYTPLSMKAKESSHIQGRWTGDWNLLFTLAPCWGWVGGQAPTPGLHNRHPQDPEWSSGGVRSPGFKLRCQKEHWINTIALFQHKYAFVCIKTTQKSSLIQCGTRLSTLFFFP